MRLAGLIALVLALLALGVHGKFGRAVAVVLAIAMATCAWLAMSSTVFWGG